MYGSAEAKIQIHATVLTKLLKTTPEILDWVIIAKQENKIVIKYKLKKYTSKKLNLSFTKL